MVPIFLEKGAEINGIHAKFYTYDYETNNYEYYYTDLVKLKRYLFKGEKHLVEMEKGNQLEAKFKLTN